MISQDAVDGALAALDSEAAVEEAILHFATSQTPFLQYLRTDSFELLSADERDYLQYLALVIHAAAERELGRVPELSGALIEGWDERCWEWLQATVGKPMTARLDRFFAEINQEELLAFAEDSLAAAGEDAADGDADPELFASGASRELGFVALATLTGGLDEVCRTASHR